MKEPNESHKINNTILMECRLGGTETDLKGKPQRRIGGENPKSRAEVSHLDTTKFNGEGKYLRYKDGEL